MRSKINDIKNYPGPAVINKCEKKRTYTLLHFLKQQQANAVLLDFLEECYLQ